MYLWRDCFFFSAITSEKYYFKFHYWKCYLGTSVFLKSSKLLRARIWMSVRMSVICSRHWVVSESLITKLIYVSCNHFNHGSIPEYLRSLDLCLVTTSLIIDWSPYQLFKTFRFILEMNCGTASQQFWMILHTASLKTRFNMCSITYHYQIF